MLKSTKCLFLWEYKFYFHRWVQGQEDKLIVDVITNILSDNKAEDVVSISLDGKSEQADFMIIASGLSNRHVLALAEKVISSIKNKIGATVRVEGLRNADWVLIDCGDVIVHIFREEVRDFYQLERMWQYLPKDINEAEKF